METPELADHYEWGHNPLGQTIWTGCGLRGERVQPKDFANPGGLPRNLNQSALCLRLYRVGRLVPALQSPLLAHCKLEKS